MTVISIPGYRAAVDNVVYTHRGLALSNDGTSTDVLQVVIPQRFREPSDKDIIDHIYREQAKLEELIAYDPSTVRKSASDLNLALLGLPQDIVRRLQAKEPDIVDLLNASISSSPNVAGEQYLVVRYGLIPFQTVELHTAAGNVIDENWYKIALMNQALACEGFGEIWQASLLTTDGKLPNQKTINMLISPGIKARDTELLKVNIGKYDSDSLRDVFEAIYIALKKSEMLDHVCDVSAIKLDNRAAKTLASFSTIYWESVRDSPKDKPELKFSRN